MPHFMDCTDCMDYNAVARHCSPCSPCGMRGQLSIALNSYNLTFHPTAEVLIQVRVAHCLAPEQPTLRTIASFPEMQVQIATLAIPISWPPLYIPGLHALLSMSPSVAKSAEMEVVVATFAAEPIPRQDTTLLWWNGPHIRRSMRRDLTDCRDIS